MATTDVTTEVQNQASPEAPGAAAFPWMWLAFLMLLGLLAPFVPVRSLAAARVGAVVLTLAMVYGLMQFVVSTTRLRLPPARLWLWLGCALVLWAVLEWLVPPYLADMLRPLRRQRIRPSTPQLLLLYGTSTLRDTALLCGAVMGGSIVSRLIHTPNMLGPVCAVVALIDVWGVLFGGIVSQLLEKTPQIAEKAMTQQPSIGAATGAGARYSIAQPSIGAGDYLFLGLLFAALHSLGMDWRSAQRLTSVLIAIALLAIVFGAPPLPGLLFIGLGAALPNLHHFKYTRDEKFALLYAGIFVVILSAALYAGVTSMLPASKPAAS